MITQLAKSVLGCSFTGILVLLSKVPVGAAGDVSAMKNVIVASNPGKFYGWPANNGAWTWEDGREILVGFASGKFVEQQGHNTAGQKDFDGMARSLDGGVTWKVESPSGYVPDAGESSPPPGGIVFDAPGFVMRVKYGNFLISQDRGKSWQGTYNFGALTATSELKDMRLTSRTGYIVTGSNSCLIFMTETAGWMANDPGLSGPDPAACRRVLPVSPVSSPCP